MASVQDLKRRVRSVKNTRKITKAMELVASARLRRAQTRIEAMRPYADTMRELIAGVGRASASVRGLPLLQQREEEKTVLDAIRESKDISDETEEKLKAEIDRFKNSFNVEEEKGLVSA